MMCLATPLPAEVNNPTARGDLIEHPAANTAPGLEHFDAVALVLGFSGGDQARETRPDNGDVDFGHNSMNPDFVIVLVILLTLS